MDNLDLFLLQTKIELDSAREQLDRKDFLQPYRHIFWMEYLMPVGLEIPTKLEAMSLTHLFISESCNSTSVNTGTVIHGHAEDKSCASPKMCHLYGFWPTLEYNPRFKRIFEARWKPTYIKFNWEIPK
jgi:hypothetical protein